MWYQTLLFVLNVYAAKSLSPFGSHKVQYKVTSSQSASEPLILTPFIKSGNISAARLLSSVTLDDFHGVESHSGYFTVNQTYNSNLFFWFFPSERNYREDPVVLWLQGGPGISSLVSIFTENGPFEIVKFQKLKRRKYSWQVNHSMLYIDNPVGTGFSFTTSRDGYAEDQIQVGEDLYKALLQFFTLFPEIQKNPFFVTGESYGGKYVASLSYIIHNKNRKANMKINLKGFAVGNGWTDPIHQLHYSKYLHETGLIDSNTKSKIEKVENEMIETIDKEHWVRAADLWSGALSIFVSSTGNLSYFNYVSRNASVDVETYSTFLNRAGVRSSIHVGNRTYHAISNFVHNVLVADMFKSVAPWFSELLNHYKGLFYVGQLDVICHYPGVVNFLTHLNFSSAEEYKTSERKIWRYKNEVAGYVKTAGNMSEVLVRNAGHNVPMDQPEWALDLITKFTSNNL